jgi:uncharacterized protein (DUF736 family)
MKALPHIERPDVGDIWQDVGYTGHHYLLLKKVEDPNTDHFYKVFILERSEIGYVNLVRYKYEYVRRG